MAYNNNQGREPFRDPWAGPAPHQQLAHRISNISEISDIDNPYDPADPAHSLRGRESIVSIDSEYDRRDSIANSPYASRNYSPQSSWSGSFSYASNGGGYTPVSVQGSGGGGPPQRTLSRGSRKVSYASVRQTFPEAIQEEDSYDLSLLRSAAPMGSGPGRYEAIREEVGMSEEEHAFVPAFDLTSTLGPMASQDEAFIHKLQEQEARGNLTGGLGQGFRAEARVRGEDILSSPVSLQRSLSKSFSRRMAKRELSRAETLRSMGQEEANRRGEVIEVIMEDEPAPADLSNMEGLDVEPGTIRHSNLPSKEIAKQVFYPQPNWKPFPMRWPYLISLILLSAGLAALQELLYQQHKDRPVITFKKPNEVKPGLYFVVKFVPTLAAVVFGVLWQFTDFEVRRLEAFYQLSKPGGALAASSINMDYTTSFNFFRPFLALRKGHYAVCVSSIATLLAVSLVPTFAAASVVLNPSRDERMAHPDEEKTLNFALVWSRLLTSTLALCGFLGCVLFYLLQSRRSGLLADVRGIAGLASMAVVSHILMDFKDMDTAPHGDIHHRLKYNRYVLRNSSLAPDDENPASSKEKQRFNDHHLPTNPHPVMLRPIGILLMIAGLLLFTGFIPAFLFSFAAVVADKVPWIVTVFAVTLKLCWGGMESACRMMEPYYILSRRHAPSKTLMLDYTALPFAYMPIRALMNGHILMFFIGFGSVMAEFLTILVSGLATVDGNDFLQEYMKPNEQINSGTETVTSFYVSVGLSLFILLYMSIVAIIVFCRRRHPFLPRQPNTIASVLAYLHQSKMLYDFVGTEKYTTAEMLRKLEGGKTYGLGWFVGRDGQKHCGVDWEELISGYKHGIDFKQGIQPWDMQWDVL